MYLITNDINHRVFANVDAAQKMADNFSDDEWTYKVVPDPKGSGKAIIKIYDEDNEFLGKL